MKSFYNFFLLILLAATVVVTGFFRDSLFKSINYFIKYFYYEKIKIYLPKILYPIKDFSYSQLVSFKWILTVLFTLWYLLLALGCIKLVFKENQFIRWTIFTYATVFILSFLFYFGFKMIHQPDLGYRFSRILMGFLQSPFALMILIPAFKISKNKKLEV